YFPPGVPGYGEERGVTVLSRVQPLFQAPGVPLGAFTVRPQLSESFGYDTNPTGFSSSPGSWLLQTSPSLALNSNWSRNSLGAAFSLDNYKYFDTTNQTHTDWTASLGGGYTIGRSDLTLGYSHLSLHQSATDVGAVPSTTPVPYQVNDLRAGYTFDLGRLSFSPNVGVRSYNFENTTIEGVSVSQEYRDRVGVTAGVTTRYNLSERRNLVFVVEGVDSHFTRPQIGQPTYNSKSFLALAGLDYESSGALRYQVLVGLEYRGYESRAFKNEIAPIAQAAVIWTPTRLTTVTGLLSRVIEDPAAEGTAGYTYTTAGVTVYHEYLRNLILTGRLSVQNAAYLQSSTSSTSFSIGAGANWLLNRNMRLSADYDFTTQNGASPSTFTGQPNVTTINTGGYTRSLILIAMHFAL
ncbi:MAG: outer membrane beta-barrel protein, partial [Acetobacteraceae bacterium]|nr:outer membrane beta-barrel protein [Acetobacteraceae bacterium]